VRKWLAAACLVLGCAAAPLFAPQAWAQRGAFPDLAALAVLYLAISGTPERAAVLGVAIGFLRGAWTPEPFGLEAALYGALGWSGAHFGRAVFQDRALIKMAAAGVGVLALRAASMGVAVVGAPPGARGPSIATWLFATLLAAVATSLAAPVVFSVLSGSRVLAAFERGRRHDV
jgi:rod shape-determining protein MreD